jgi:hypothetical protein
MIAKEKSWRIATDGTVQQRKEKTYIKKELNPLYIVTTFNILAECVGLGYVKKKEVLLLIKEMEVQANFIYNKDEYDAFVRQL